VLFRGAFADTENCPKCDLPRYKDIDWKKFLVKVLRYFLVTPRLQRMFRSPTILKLILRHFENNSSREGGDNLVRHPCNSEAWHHFYNNIDPTFGEDP
jgi:hypothetical protein